MFNPYRHQGENSLSQGMGLSRQSFLLREELPRLGQNITLVRTYDN